MLESETEEPESGGEEFGSGAEDQKSRSQARKQGKAHSGLWPDSLLLSVLAL